MLGQGCPKVGVSSWNALINCDITWLWLLQSGLPVFFPPPPCGIVVDWGGNGGDFKEWKLGS